MLIDDHGRDTGTVNVRRVLRASRERVFAAWTEPTLIRQWNARSGLTVPLAEVDLSVGGRYRLHLLAPDGALHRISGVYRVVEPTGRLAYSWIDETAQDQESLVTVLFQKHPNGTEVILRHESLPSSDARRRHTSGWQACLLELERVLHESDFIAHEDACE